MSADDQAALDAAAREAAAGMAPETPAASDAPGAAMPPAQPSTADVLAPLVATAFRIVAPAWNVSDAEARELAGAWAPVLDKYFPGGLVLSVEFNAVIVTLALIGPRWGKPRELPAPSARSVNTDDPAARDDPAPDDEDLRPVGE